MQNRERTYDDLERPEPIGPVLNQSWRVSQVPKDVGIPQEVSKVSGSDTSEKG